MAIHTFETSAFDATSAAPANDSSPLLGTCDAGLIFGAGKGWARAAERRVQRPLSPRERQILTLVIDGKTRKEIAYELDLAHSTVRVLYSRAMKKLGGCWQPRAREEQTLRQ